MAITWVSPSPHITKNYSTNTIIIDYIFAIFPTFVLSLFLFGVESMLVVLFSVLSAILFEMIYNMIYRQKFVIQDASSILTGMLIGLTLPPATPFYIPIVATAFAILLVKMCFGGYGSGFVNEVAIARIFIVLFYTGVFVSSYVVPTLVGSAGDKVTLIQTIMEGKQLPSFKDMFFGNVVGAMGETAIITLLIGGIYLIAKRVIDYKVPLIYLGTVALLILFTKGAGMVLPFLMSGGLVFGAFFLATDFATCPDTLFGRIVYPIFLGVLTVLIWFFGDYQNAVYYAIIFGGIFSSILSNYYRPKAYGSERRKA